MKKQRLYFRPRRPPKWWPRVGRIFKFVGVVGDCADGSSAWVDGEGTLFGRRQIVFVKEMIRSDWPKCLFKVK